MKRTDTAKLYVMAFLMAVVVFGAVSVPNLTERPPDTWVITFGLTCVALGVLIGFGIRELLMPDGDE